MFLLSIDSSDGYSNILITDEKLNKISESVSDFHERHSVLIFKQLDEMMKESGVKFSDFTGIAVILGPGSYTGTRVSLTIAKTLSSVLEIYVAGVGSLFLCAYYLNKNAGNSKNIVAVKNSTKGHYYVSDFLFEEPGFILSGMSGIKTNLLNMNELKLFLGGKKNNFSLVYGYNKENDREKFKSEFESINPPSFFELRRINYYASMYILENNLNYDLKYAEEVSPYYVYGNGPF